MTKMQVSPDETRLKNQLMTDLREQAEDDSAMRGLIFAQLISAGFDVSGPNFLIQAIAKQDITVVKETALFVLIRYTPPFLLNQVTQFEATNESVGQS